MSAGRHSDRLLAECLKLVFAVFASRRAAAKRRRHRARWLAHSGLGGDAAGVAEGRLDGARGRRREAGGGGL